MTKPKKLLAGACAVALIAVIFIWNHDSRTYRVIAFTPQGYVHQIYLTKGRPSISGAVYRFTTKEGKEVQIPVENTQVTTDLISAPRFGGFQGF